MALLPDDDVLDELERIRARERRVQPTLARPDLASVAEVAAANRRAYPHLKPGDTMALAGGGLGPGTVEARAVAKARAKVKVKRGFGWHSVGDVVRGAARVTTTALAAPGEAIGHVTRHYAKNIRERGVLEGAARATFSGADEPKTTLGIALLGREGEGKGDLGSGYLPGGGAARIQAERAREYGTIDGHAITLGRLSASTIVEPGTKPYTTLSGLVDMAVAIGADPANVALKASAKGAQAAKLFVAPEPGVVAKAAQSVGLVNGVRKTVDVDRVQEWLESPAGRGVVNGIAGESDFDTLWRRLGKKVDVEDVLELSRRTDPDAVKEYLYPLLGTTIREKPSLATRSTNATIRRIRDARLFQGMPEESITFDDPNKAVETVDRWLRNAGVTDPRTIAKHTFQMAKATTRGGTGADRFTAVTSAAKVVEDALLTHGVDKDRARELTRLFRDSQEELRKFNVDDIGGNAWFPGVKVGADSLPAASPHLIVEALNSKVMLPDAREIRQLTSRFRGALEFAQTPLLTLEHLQQKIWRPAVLLRGAYVPRVIGEEQLRMAGAGFTSFANHPISALATVLGDESSLGRIVGKVPGVETGRAEADIFGELFKDAAKRAPKPTEFENALYKGRVVEPVGRARTVATRQKVVYKQDAPEYAKSWGEEILQLRSDPIGQRVAAGGIRAGDRGVTRRPGMSDMDELKEWLWSGTGRALLDELTEQGVDVGSRPNLNAYVDSVAERVRVKTGGNDELVDAVAFGEFRGEALRVGDTLNPKFVKALNDVKHLGPVRVKGDLTVARGGGASDLGARWDSALNHLFSAIMVTPSNVMSRGPVFRQVYYQRLSELAPFMTDEAVAKVAQGARAAKMGDDYVKQLRNRLSSKAAKTLDEENADLIAKGYALETTRALLYDIGDKGQFADQVRLLIPFAEAFKEQMTRWSKIVVENPRVVRRAQQTIEGARGAGWFFTDSNGEESFRYPGTAFLSEHLLGARVPLTGRVQGLSLAGNLLPGFGPVVQIPMSQIIPNKPEADWLREIVLPFGDPDMEGGALPAFMPAWMKRFHTALFESDPETDRLFANSVMDVASYLVSTGDHTTDSPEAVDRLMADATRKARGLFVLRGFSQFFAPAAPSPEFLAADKDGNLMVARKLTEEFHALEADDYDTAAEKFLATYGDGALLLMQGKTRGGAPPTEELDRWVREHPEVRDKYRTVYGFFGPSGADTFSSEFYGRQIRSGEREALTPNEAVALANHRVAALAFRQAKEKVAGRTDLPARQWLAKVRSDLVDVYPGYEPMPRDLGKTDRTIRELQRAVKDPVLAATDAGQGIAAYLQVRENVLEVTRRDLDLTSGFGKAKRAKYLRDYLRNEARKIAAEYPDFAEAWEMVLSREMTDDEPTEEEVA